MQDFKKKYKHIRNTPLVFLFYFLHKLFSIIPRNITFSLGKLSGKLFYFLSKKDKKIAISNLNLIYGEKFDNEIIAKNCFENIGINLFEYLYTSSDKHFNKIIGNTKVENLEFLDKLYNQKKGVIAITSHLSNFELIPLYIAYLGYPVAVIGRKLFDERIDNLLIKMRERIGIKNIPSDISPRKIFELLDNNYIFGILLDQKSDSVANIDSNFMGNKSKTSVGPIKIALKRNMPVIPVSIRRNGLEYTIKFGEPIHLNNCTVDDAVSLVNESLAKMILENPTEWMWMHKKWD